MTKQTTGGFGRPFVWIKMDKLLGMPTISMFKKAINDLLSDPTYKPPENFFELEITKSFRSFLSQFDSITLIKFALGEAKLVLPLYVEVCSSNKLHRGTLEPFTLHNENSSPQNVLKEVENYISNKSMEEKYFHISGNIVGEQGAKALAIHAADTAYAAYGAAYSDNSSNGWSDEATLILVSDEDPLKKWKMEQLYDYVEYAACAAELADNSIVLKDQLKRLLEI